MRNDLAGEMIVQAKVIVGSSRNPRGMKNTKDNVDCTDKAESQARPPPPLQHRFGRWQKISGNS